MVFCHSCHLNLKLHKRKPSPSILLSTLLSWPPLRSTTIYQEPPRSYLPLTWALLAAASAEGRPPTTSSVKKPLKRKHPLPGSSPGAFSTGLAGEPPRCFLGSAQRHPLPGPSSESPLAQSGLPAAYSGGCSPPSRTFPALGLPPLRVPRGFPAGLRHWLSPALGRTRGRGRRRLRRDSFVTGPRER